MTEMTKSLQKMHILGSSKIVRPLLAALSVMLGLYSYLLARHVKLKFSNLSMVE